MAFGKNLAESLIQNTLYQFICWLCTGGIVTIIATIIRMYRSDPFSWNFVILTFVISFLVLAVATLLVVRRQQLIQPQPRSEISPISNVANNAAVVEGMYFAIDRTLTQRFEASLARFEQEIPDISARDIFWRKVIVVGMIYWDFESTWNAIWRSQYESLVELNSRQMARDELSVYYNAASVAYPAAYGGYPFDHWLGFMRTNGLLVENGHLISITIRGREFIKFCVGEGKSLSHKLY